MTNHPHTQFLAFSTNITSISSFSPETPVPQKNNHQPTPQNHIETHPAHIHFELPESSAIAKFLFGANHAVLLYESGNLYTSGSNSHGELGNGTTEPLEYAREWHKLAENVMDCGIGLHHTVYLTKDCRVFAVGRGYEGQLGVASAFGKDLYESREVRIGNATLDTSSEAPRMQPLPVSDRIVRVQCGAYHTVLQAHNGICYAFGRGIEGQLGNLGHLRSSVKTQREAQQNPQEDSQQNPRLHAFSVCQEASNPMSIYLQYQPTPKPIKCLEHTTSHHQKRRPFSPIVQVGCGENYTAMLAEDGRVLMSGEGRTGVLGRGKCASHNYLVEEVQYLSDKPAASQISKQRAIDVQIELERIPPPPKPKIIDQEEDEEIRDEDCTFKIRTSFGIGIVEDDTDEDDAHHSHPDIIQMANGWNHSLLLSSTGVLYSCGLNLHGQCGLNHRRTQVQYDKIPKTKAFAKEQIVDIGCGNTYSAILTSTGRLYVMGRLPGERAKKWGAKGDYLVPTELQYFARRGLAVERMYCGARDLVLEVAELQ